MHRSSDLAVEIVAEIPPDLRHMAMEATPATGPEQVAPFPANPDDVAAMPPADVAPGAAHPTVAQKEELDDLEILPSMTPLTGARAARELPVELGQMERPTRAAVASAIDRGRPAPIPEAGPVGSEAAADAPVVPGAALAAASAESGATPASALQVVAALTGRGSPHSERGDHGAEPQILEPANTDARVILHAIATSWIQIASESGNYQRTRTLEPGDVFLVPNRRDLQLWTGNAGGVEVFLDGDRLPPLGAAGTVVRDVSLDPERLLARWQAED